MFPNPQDALPLPRRASIEKSKKSARALLRAGRSSDPEAVLRWAEKWVAGLAKGAELRITRGLPVRLQRWVDQVTEFARRELAGAEGGGGKSGLADGGAKKGSGRCTLGDAQRVIARAHGFASWAVFSRHLEALEQRNSPVARFELAVEAIVHGNAARVKRLLLDDPELAQMRSEREHGATLLHYCAANGVEGYRQLTPKNIPKITEALLRAGAEVDATANVYGGGCTTLGLAATSVHPEHARVQEALLERLLDHGAKMDRPSIAGGESISIVASCLANGREKAAKFLARRGAPLDLASTAAVGRLDALKKFFNADGSLKSATQEELQSGFRAACGCGRDRTVEFLLADGMAPEGRWTPDSTGQTALHRAVIGGHLSTVKLLLRYAPPLEARNMYGGTALGQGMWSAAHGGDAETYIAIFEALLAAGAKLPERHVPINGRMDAWLAKRGSRPEPSWHWYGEEPRRGKR